MSSRTLTLLGYVVIAVVAVGLELAARRSRRLATFGDATTVVLRHRLARIVVLAGWLWLGWHLFARVDWQ